MVIQTSTTVTMALSRFVPEIKRDIDRKSQFFISLCIWCPVMQSRRRIHGRRCGRGYPSC